MPAPYSDNLYSAADLSDDETDALSPTDGYFHASSRHDAASSSSPPFQHLVPHRPNVFVEDPTIAAEPSAKAREADIEASAADFTSYPPLSQHTSQSSSTGQLQHPYIPVHHQPSALHSSLFSHHRDAPPAYTPSPTSPTSANSSSSPRTGYQTFGPSNSTMGLPEDQQRLIPRPPESMGDPPNLPEPSRWQQCKDFVVDPDLRSKVKKPLYLLGGLLIIAILLTTLTTGGRHPHRPIVDDNRGKQPIMDHDKLTWKPIQGCRNSDLNYKNNTFWAGWASNRSLRIVQDISRKEDRPLHGRTPHVTGDVIVRPTDDASAGTIDVEVMTNDQDINVVVDISDGAQQVTVTTPRQVAWDSSFDGPCIQISITVWAPKEATLKSFSINTVQLDVLVEEGLNIGLLHPYLITTVTGNVNTPLLPAKGKATAKDISPYKLNTREIRVSTASGDVKGWFPLFDVLDIRTTSGDISIDASPKPVDEKRPKPAALRANSHSGSISVDERIGSPADEDIPARDYTVELSTNSGPITAKVAASSLAQIRSQSGDLDLVFLPVINLGTPVDDPTASFKTEATSGDSDIVVLEPVWTDRAAPAFGLLTSKHTSVSGGITIVYPSSWEGSLSTSTISGKQSVRGQGVQIDEREDNPWSKRTEAHKGAGKSRLDVKAISGNIDVLIGKA